MLILVGVLSSTPAFACDEDAGLYNDAVSRCNNAHDAHDAHAMVVWCGRAAQHAGVCYDADYNEHVKTAPFWLLHKAEQLEKEAFAYYILGDARQSRDLQLRAKAIAKSMSRYHGTDGRILNGEAKPILTRKLFTSP
jgi:hypothetical protein